MKKFLVAIMFTLASLTAFAEASFDQIQSLIQQGQYQAAANGLEGIIQNHPKSAKAFYAMAQAQAGLGNLEKAKKALDIATGLNPTLDFAPASSVASLKQAITPQTAKIETIETSHFWRNFAYFALFAGFGVACYFLYSVYARKQEQEEAAKKEKEAQWAKEMDEAQERHNKFVAEKAAKEQEQAVATPQPKKTKKQLKEEADALALREATARAEAAEADARRARMHYSTPAPAPTVVNNSGNDMLTGVLIGNMLSSSHHSHDTERTVVRETVREVPAPSRDSSWDDTPSRSSSRSSSWDDDSSSSNSRSSSWDSSSSSDSSSSWSDSSSSSSSDSSW